MLIDNLQYCNWSPKIFVNGAKVGSMLFTLRSLIMRCFAKLSLILNSGIDGLKITPILSCPQGLQRMLKRLKQAEKPQ